MLGQLQDKAASAALSNILMDTNEHPMVRHEAAEALGSIAGMTAIVYCVLQIYSVVHCRTSVSKNSLDNNILIANAFNFGFIELSFWFVCR